MRTRVIVRMAKNEDGPRVGELVCASGFKQDGWEIDWNDIEPWWFVVELGG